jgi:hypothetical protein
MFLHRTWFFEGAEKMLRCLHCVIDGFGIRVKAY